MSKEVYKETIYPLFYRFDNLYNKYTLLSSIDYKDFGVVDGEFDKSFCCATLLLSLVL